MGGKKKQPKQPQVTIPEGDPVQGKTIFSDNCQACHAIHGNDKGAAGPILGGLFGRATGSTEFPAGKALKNAGFKWTEKHLFMYLLNPGKYIPGIKMAFGGLPNEQDRADLIAYLKQFN